jgi:CBS domain-containing protein
MSDKVVSVSRGTPLSEIVKTFRDKNHHVLPVLEKDKTLVGMLDFEDVLKVFEPIDSETKQMLKSIPFIDQVTEQQLSTADLSPEMGFLVVADDIMSTKLVTVTPEDDINQAYNQMKVHEIQRLFVVEDEKLVGIICLFDIILALFKESGVI